MRIIARRLLAGNSLSHIIQPTELANETVIRLLKANLDGVADRGHMLSLAARTMRQALIDEARRGQSAKRRPPTLMTAWSDRAQDNLINLDDLDMALKALSAVSPERAEIVELRFMLGMTVEETAAACKMSERTVKRHWQAARAWLMSYLLAPSDVAHP
jgi:RNA polymerase sigma factor (TIGR02999 family)